MAFCTHPASLGSHVRAGRFACAGRLTGFAALLPRSLALLVLTLPFLPPAATAEAPFTSSFPHLFYNDTGWLDGNVEIMAQFDVLTTAFWNQDGPTASKLDSLKTLNPAIQRLAYVNPAGLSLPEVGDPNHVVNRFAAGIRDEWIVRNETGQVVYFDPSLPNMPLLNLSNRCPRVLDRTWGEYLADFAVTEFLSTGLWEGVLFDNTWSGVSWVNASIPGSVDLDGNGVADPPDSADVWWVAGNSEYMTRFRSLAAPGVLAMGNGHTPLVTHLNGRYFEDFPFREGWTRSMQRAADWLDAGREPSLLAMVTRSTEDDFQLMRYGLCSALVAGVFSHHFAQNQSWPNSTIYDEYRIDLGQPLGPPAELGIDIVGEADFESGVPAGFGTRCGSGRGTWTTDPALVVEGGASLLGSPGGGPEVWQIFLCTDPGQVVLSPDATYSISFSYRIVSDPPPGGYFFLGARSDVDIDGSDRAAVLLQRPAGTLGQARGELTLGPYPGYYLRWGLKYGGEIVIDSVTILSGRGGVFRRDFERGIALVNPTGEERTVLLEPGYHRLAGAVDPATNNGEAVSQLTLAPEDGLVLLAGAAVHPIPAAPLFFSFPNPVPMASAMEVAFSGPPQDGSIAIVTPLGRVVRHLTAANQGAGGAWRWDLKNASNGPVASGFYLAVIRDAGKHVLGSARLTLRR